MLTGLVRCFVVQVFGGVHNYKTKMCEVYERLSRVCVQVGGRRVVVLYYKRRKNTTPPVSELKYDACRNWDGVSFAHLGQMICMICMICMIYSHHSSSSRSLRVPHIYIPDLYDLYDL